MYNILKPAAIDEKPEVLLLTLSEFRAAREIVDSFSVGPLGLDFETNTYDYMADRFVVRCAGLANDDYTVCVDLLNADPEDLQLFKEWLLKQEFVAHNAAMECGTLLRWAGSQGCPVGCTKVLHSDLAAEEGRPHNLSFVMQDLLGQPKEGDKVAEYMKANKMGWEDVLDMDFAVLGRYCAIDAWGTWKAYQVMGETVSAHGDTWGPFYWPYHQEDCLNLVKLQVEARQQGIDVVVDELEKSFAEVSDKKEAAWQAFLTHETIAPHIEAYNNYVVSEFAGKEPPKFRKDGAITARWTNWQAKIDKLRQENHFNPNSAQQLRWLLFGKLGIKPVEYTEGGEPSTAAKYLHKFGLPGKLLLDYRGLKTKLQFITQIRDSENKGKIRPHVRVHATVTTRCAAGEVS